MIVELAIAVAVALTLAPPVEDVQLPTCSIGEEAQPFEDGYVCGPADPAVPELEIPSPGPIFTAEPAPWPDTTPHPIPTPAPPTLEPDPDPVEAAPTAPQLPPAEPAPHLAETGIVEERITALSVFAAIAIALGAGIVLTVMIRRRPSLARGFDHLRDENGYYTKLKPTDPGYPYGGAGDAVSRDGSGARTGTASVRLVPRQSAVSRVVLQPLEVDRSARRPDRVDGTRLSPQLDVSGGAVRGSGDDLVAEFLELSVVDRHQLLAAEVNVPRHDASLPVLDVEVAPSTSSDQTVGDAADTAVKGSFPLGSQQERRRTRGGSDDAAAPHSTQGGTQ